MRATLLFIPILALGCGSDPKPPATAPVNMPEPASSPPMAETPDDPKTAVLDIDPDIRKLCGISDAEAHFAFNSARVRPQDQAVLKKLADCFSTGKLKGRQMRLVGHADPRGESEYNMVLGGRRADNVKDAISNQGLAAKQIATSSRGELDAVGTDETSWARDRRVNVLLGN